MQEHCRANGSISTRLTILASSIESIHANEAGYPHRVCAYSASFRDIFQMHNALDIKERMTFSLERTWRNFRFRGDCGDFQVVAGFFDCGPYKKHNFSSPETILPNMEGPL
ncbi:hypothetical protein TNCV_1403981 [Trichonephila clavipes]|nr:hypothetical protein TNCV_1403981 [Trichonephila clavipes]